VTLRAGESVESASNRDGPELHLFNRAIRPRELQTGEQLNDQIVFSFYNDQLFRVVVDYAHDRTEGMTDADTIEAISAGDGCAAEPDGSRRPPERVVASQLEVESGSPVARWGDAGHAVVLYRTSSYREVFRLIVTEPALDALARKATTQAMRLDEIDAPRREIARQKKERDDGRAAAEKVRIANKGAFRP
jgi:hypothetical protein